MLYVAHTDHNTGYYNVEVLVPLSAITTTSDSASASEQATPPPKPQWQSWVTGVAWYPDNNPLIAKESQIICNIESSEQAKAGSPNTVSVVATQLLVQQRLKPNHSEHLQFVRRESIQQVKQILKLLHRATGQWGGAGGSGTALTELQPKSTYGREFFLLHESVAVWQRTCGLPLHHHSVSQQQLVNAVGEKEKEKDKENFRNLIHFGVFASSIDDQRGIVKSLLRAGFECRKANCATATTSNIGQVDLVVPSACVSVVTGEVTESASSLEEEKEKKEKAECFGVDQRIFFEESWGGGLVVMRLNFLNSVCEQGVNVLDAYASNECRHATSLDLRKRRGWVERRYTQVSTGDGGSSSSSSMRTSKVLESIPHLALCWLDLFGTRVAAQCV